MTEDFLHYTWKFRNYGSQPLFTQKGELVQVFHPGNHNNNAGPDFSEAKIQIGEKIWAGHVEIHIKSDDWHKHGHQNDAAYNNVILHVVYEYTKPVLDPSGNEIPTLVLNKHLNHELFFKYQRLVSNSTPIPCAANFRDTETLIRESMTERVLAERLQEKSQKIESLWQENEKDWNETFYQWMAYGFGLKVNAESMLLLSQMLPQKILAKHKNSRFQLEALLFGAAGLLQNSTDDYAKELQTEFKFLKAKYNLTVLKPSIWKLARLRPPSFPELRIAQFANLIYNSENLFSKILATGSLKVLQQLLSQSPSPYWQAHYRFGLEHPKSKGAMGKPFIEIMVINVLVPFLFLYGSLKDESFYKQRALDLLDQLGAENNKVTRIYEDLGYTPRSAFESQAQLQLYGVYCQPKKCLNCAIGNHLLKRS